MKTLLFCTAYADIPLRWQLRYRKWLDAFARSRVERERILLIDDGSASLPDWRGVRVLDHLPAVEAAEKQVLYHFPDNLGRPQTLIYPGWFRSFTFAAVYAQRYGYDKLVHVESDCFFYSDRMVDFVNGLDTGWTAFWCPRWQFPESCIQVICGESVGRLADFAGRDYLAELSNRTIETVLPFTRICKDFVGDRYGEYLDWLPEDADYGCQIPESWP